jgi:signal peptidase I
MRKMRSAARAILAIAGWMASAGVAPAEDVGCAAWAPQLRAGAFSMAPALLADVILQLDCRRPSAPGEAGAPAPLPSRGDVILFRRPGQPSDIWVKRVIALPGERVRFRGGRLWLNGVEVPRQEVGVELLSDAGRPPVRLRRYREALPGTNAYDILEAGDDRLYDRMAEIVVPVGHVFVAGDNRDHSIDSREIERFGTVRAEYVIARVTRLVVTSP